MARLTGPQLIYCKPLGGQHKGQRKDELIPFIEYIAFPREEVKGQSLIPFGIQEQIFSVFRKKKCKQSGEEVNFFQQREILSMGFIGIHLLHGTSVGYL